MATLDEEKMLRLFELNALTKDSIYTQVSESWSDLEEMFELATKANAPFYLVNCLHRKGIVYNLLYDVAKANEHLMQASELAEKNELSSQMPTLLIDLASSHINTKNYELAKKYLASARKYLQNKEQTEAFSFLLCIEAYLAFSQNHFEHATKLFLEADKQANWKNDVETIQQSYYKTLIYSGLGGVYQKTENYPKAIDYYEQAIALCETKHIFSRITWYYLHLGNLWSALKNYASASVFFQKIIEETTGDVSQHTRASALGNLGQISFRQGDVGQALDYFAMAEQIYQAEANFTDENYNLAGLERMKSFLYLEVNNDLPNTLFYLENALAYAKKHQDSAQIAGLYNDLAFIFEKKQDYKQAFHYQKLHSQTRELVVSQERTRALSELQIRYETEKKERMTELLRRQTTELQLKALRSQMNPHFIFNCLNSIQKFISENDSHSAELYLAKFAKLIRSILENSEREVITLESEIIFLKEYLTLEKLRFKDEFEYIFDVEADLEDDIIEIPPMIIQPYIENAIIHGIRGVNNGKINISFKSLGDNAIYCIVEDNGIGRTASQAQQRSQGTPPHRSLGTIVTLERLKLLNKDAPQELLVTTEDIKNGDRVTGTRVAIKIPILNNF